MFRREFHAPLYLTNYNTSVQVRKWVTSKVKVYMRVQTKLIKESHQVGGLVGDENHHGETH